ncbi:MAG TPA: phosphoglucosamine mutase [Acidimicrobiales bacterium]|nr:phosphoglucosamine mutase [Acidimicrobiales bacterium]
MTLRFGTDGIRGVAGTELTAALAQSVGAAAARVLGGPRFLVGRDTRESGPWLHSAFAAGVVAAGVDVVDLGVIPTPGVADLAFADGVPAAVISASHNPYTDNGIKLLSAGGRKLTDEQEAEVESLLASPCAPRRPGSVTTDTGAVGRYISLLSAPLEGRTLGGLPVVIDCANGSASVTAPQVLEAAGVSLLEVLAAEPDGRNINDHCGSTDPTRLSNAVRARGAAVGLAFDGDADRVIAVDERGEVVDGDRLIALFAADLRSRGLLAGGGVAVTVMTNLGFHRAMDSLGVTVESTPVGDRFILEALLAKGWALGGEQSGHIIFRDLWPGLAPTGDGVLTGLVLLDLLTRSGQPLSQLAGESMARSPQVLRNVRVADHRALPTAAAVWDEVAAVEAELGAEGRVLLRPSGTEPLVRVMVEAPSEDVAERVVDRLSSAVVAALGPA